ncbi:hypothetical protein D869_gp267 [Caulobacter phage CcrRogue]|uniref:Uncharacterized protein n=1 Tax=Caulobacter phage CcrRogue TaxID=2927986 RepID=K4K347_9CAUD|nr:hypothetical protein D869_gp267 [Caulobacter phage CcrRogue]AFU86647.1 hypothetical protein CcrRogue_gp165 [Caulobacter phage CcrRogue]
MIRFIHRHGGLIYPTVLIGTGMNVVTPHAVWTDRLAFFLVAIFPSVIIATFLAAQREAKEAEAIAKRRQSLAAKAHAVIWGATLDHPDLRRADDPAGDWMRLLLAPSGSAIKMLSERPLTLRTLRELSGVVAIHGETLLRLHNLGLTEDFTWSRINAVAAALTQDDLNPKLVTDLLALVEDSLAFAIPAPAQPQ